MKKNIKYIYFFIMFIIMLFCFCIESSASSDSYSLEYLRMPSSSFYTDYVPNSNTRVVLDYEADELTCWISYIEAGGTKFLLQSNNNPSSLSFFYNDISVDGTLTLNSGRHVIDLNCGTLNIDGYYLAQSSNSSLSCSNSDFLGLNTNNFKPGIFNVYSLKIYESDMLVRDYQPYFQNGNYGFKEVVNNNFYSVDKSSGSEFSFPSINPSISSDASRVAVISTQAFPGLNLELFELRYSLDNSSWKRMIYNSSDDTWFISISKNGTYKFRYCYKGTENQVEGTSTSTLSVTNIIADGDEFSNDIVTPIFSVDFWSNDDGSVRNATIRTQYMSYSEISDLQVYYKDTLREYNEDMLLWSTDSFKSEIINGVTYYYFEWDYFENVTLICSFYNSNLKKFSHTSSITIDLDVLYEEYQKKNDIPSLLDTIIKTLNFLNPFSSEFFGYKLIGLFGNLLKSLFVPSDDYFSNYVEELKSEVSKKMPYSDYVKIFESLENVSEDGSITIDFPEYKISDNLTIKQDKFIDFSFVTKYRDTWYAWVRGALLIFLVIYNINQISKFLRGINISEAATSFNTVQPSPWSLQGQTSLFGRGDKK